MESTKTGHRAGRVRPLADRAWPGLLAPEQAVPWKPPHALFTLIETGLANPDTRQAFTASNRLSLELYRAGQGEAAKDVCRRQIAFAASGLRQGREAREPWLVLLGLQSAVNLIRIHGYGESLELALEGLARLEELADGESAEVFGFRVPAHTLDGETAFGRRVRAFARGNVVIETSKTFFRRGLSEQRIGEIGYLCAKWPGLRTDGPFHAHELLCLHGHEWPGSGNGTVAPVLDVIARVRRLSAADDDTPDANAAMDLYREREQPQPNARVLAALGEALYLHGEPSAAEDCFLEAHGLAAPVDPALANGISRRWSSHDADCALLPPTIPVPRPDPSRLLQLAELVATRFSTR